MLAQVPQPAMRDFWIRKLIQPTDSWVVVGVLMMLAQGVASTGVESGGDERLQPKCLA